MLLDQFSRVYFPFSNYLSISQFWIVLSRKLLIQAWVAIHQVKDIDAKSVYKNSLMYASCLLPFRHLIKNLFLIQVWSAPPHCSDLCEVMMGGM